MKWISDLIDLIFPRHCLVCGETLTRQEQHLCLNCLSTLPKLTPQQRREIEKSFWGKVPIERATSFIHYRKGSPFNALLHSLKYRNRPQVGEYLARMAADEFIAEEFFNGIDLIIPLPLSKKKQRRRGYNQSYHIALGLSQRTGIPVLTDAVIRTIANESQTHKSRDERWRNVEGIFALKSPLAIEGKHILLVDDILTTGATLCSCAATITRQCNCKVSILTLATTHNGI